MLLGKYCVLVWKFTSLSRYFRGKFLGKEALLEFLAVFHWVDCKEVRVFPRLRFLNFLQLPSPMQGPPLLDIMPCYVEPGWVCWHLTLAARAESIVVDNVLSHIVSMHKFCLWLTTCCWLCLRAWGLGAGCWYLRSFHPVQLQRSQSGGPAAPEQ